MPGGNGADVVLRDGSRAVLREAVRGDARQLLALYESIAAEGPLTVVAPDEIRSDPEAEAKRIADMAESEGSLCLVAARGSRIMGTARAEGGSLRRLAHFAEVSSVWVGPEWRGLGVADALMTALVEWAERSERIEKLGLYVFSTSAAALSLYRKHGFSVEGRGVRDMKFEDGGYADTVIMARFTGAGRKGPSREATSPREPSSP